MRSLIAVWLILLFAGTCTASDYYNCRRPGFSCGNGTCQTNGSCECPQKYITVNNDCIPNATYQRCNESNECILKHSECMQDGNVTWCICNDNFTGEHCQFPRFEVECKVEEMTVIVRPYKGFQGVIFSTTGKDDPVCHLINETSSAIQLFKKTFSLNDPQCGIKVDFTGGRTQYELDIAIKYGHDSSIQSQDDQLLSAFCYFNSTVNLSSNISVLGFRNAIRANPQHAEGNVNVLTLTISKVEDHTQEQREATSVTVGDSLNITVTMTRNSAYTKIMVSQVTATSGISASEQIVLLQECNITNPDLVRGNLSYTSDALSATLPIFAFKFWDSNDVIFSVNVIMCSASDSTTCVQCSTFLHRRRRDATSKEVNLTEFVHVQSNISQAVEKGNSHSSSSIDKSSGAESENSFVRTQSGIRSTETVVIMTVLASAVVVLLIVCIVLCIRQPCKRSPKKTDISLQIPRVRLDANPL